MSKLSIFFIIAIMFIALGSVSLVGAVGTYPAVDPSMVLYYHFNNQSEFGENDTHVYDFSGNGNDGTTNATYVFNQGVLLNEGSYSYDGAGQITTIPSTIVINALNNYTQCAWALTKGQEGISNGNIFIANAPMRSTLDFHASSQKIRMTLGTNSKTIESSTFNNNTWYFVCTRVTNYNSTSASGSLLVDGKLIGTTIFNGTNNIENIRMGVTLNGFVDEVIIYNRSLSDSEVLDMYNNYKSVHLNSSITLDGRDFNLNGINTGIIINNSNIYLDCNGSSFYGGGSQKGITITNQRNITILNCELNNYNSSIYGYNISDSIIGYNNIFNDSKHAIHLTEGSNNNIIINNIINYTHKGILIQGTSSISSGVSSINNTISYNTIMNSPDENGIDLFALANNNTISYNNISYIWAVGIILNRDVHNNIVSNNIVTNTENDGIQIRGYTDGGKTGNSTNNLLLNNVVINASYKCGLTYGNCAQGFFISFYSNNNIINNNTVMGSNGNCFESSINSTFNEFKYNTGILCKGNGLEINDYNSAYIYNNTFTQAINKMYLFRGLSRIVSFEGLFDGLIPNIGGDIDSNIILKQQTRALVYYLNNSGFICNEDCMFEITPNNYSYVLDNYNITEGLSRQYDPIWFSSSSSTSKHIASNLSNDITSTVVFNVDNCKNIGNIVQTSPSGYTHTYQRGLFSSYSCSNNQVTINNVLIEPSAESNEFTITYSCDDFTRLGGSLIMIFTALAVVALCFVYINFRGGLTALDMKDLLMMFMLIILGVIFWLSIGQTIGSNCPVS